MRNRPKITNQENYIEDIEAEWFGEKKIKSIMRRLGNPALLTLTITVINNDTHNSFFITEEKR